jgi:hypothetical protein
LDNGLRRTHRSRCLRNRDQCEGSDDAHRVLLRSSVPILPLSPHSSDYAEIIGVVESNFRTGFSMSTRFQGEYVEALTLNQISL